METTEIKADFEEKLDMFIIKLGLCRKGTPMEPKITEGIKSYFKNEYKWKPMSIQQT